MVFNETIVRLTTNYNDATSNEWKAVNEHDFELLEEIRNRFPYPANPYKILKQYVFHLSGTGIYANLLGVLSTVSGISSFSFYATTEKTPLVIQYFGNWQGIPSWRYIRR